MSESKVREHEIAERSATSGVQVVKKGDTVLHRRARIATTASGRGIRVFNKNTGCKVRDFQTRSETGFAKG